MTLHATWGAAPRTDLSLWRRLAVRALASLSRGLDHWAYALEFPEPAGPAPEPLAQIEVARDPHTGFTVLYVNGERSFTFVSGLDRL